MNLDEAVAFLKSKGIPVLRANDRFIRGGTTIEAVTEDGFKHNFVKDHFLILQDDNLDNYWVYIQDLGQISVTCKASRELSDVVEAVPWYFAIKDKMGDPDYVLLKNLVTLHRNYIFAEIAPNDCINVKFSQTPPQETDDDWAVIRATINGTYPTTHSGTLSLSDDGWKLVIEQTQQELFFATLEEATEAIVKMISYNGS